MLKPLMIALAVAALATVACGGGGSTTPAPSSLPASPTPNPKITKATVSVTNVLGTPLPQIPVEESTPASQTSPRPGKPFDTVLTNKKGLAKFLDLKPSKTYCWVAKLAPGKTSSACATWDIWQSSDIALGP